MLETIKQQIHHTYISLHFVSLSSVLLFLSKRLLAVWTGALQRLASLRCGYVHLFDNAHVLYLTGPLHGHTLSNQDSQPLPTSCGCQDRRSLAHITRDRQSSRRTGHVLARRGQFKYLTRGQLYVGLCSGENLFFISKLLFQLVVCFH